MGNDAADAAGDVCVQTGKLKGMEPLLDHGALPFQGVHGDGTFDQDHKLIAAEASDQVGDPEELGQEIPDLAKKLIAGIVSQSIVDIFKIIQIEQKQGAVLGGSPVLQEAVGSFLKCLLVQNAGQEILLAQLLVPQTQVEVITAQMKNSLGDHQ